MNILTKSILTLVALAATGLHAEVFPIAEDTFGTTAKGTILKASGAAKAVIINSKTKAYMSFDVGSSGIPASAVSNARLTIYAAKATKTGTLYLANATGAFSETFTDKSIPMPSDNIISTVGLTDAASREFITFDVTNQVKAWLANPSSENGFVLTADGTLALTIATKEGAGTGHPAILEVDVTPTTITGGSASFTGGVSSTGFSTDGTNASFFVNTGFPPENSRTLVASFLGKNSNGPQLRFQEDGSSNFVDIGTDGSDNFVIENRSTRPCSLSRLMASSASAQAYPAACFRSARTAARRTATSPSPPREEMRIARESSSAISTTLTATLSKAMSAAVRTRMA